MSKIGLVFPGQGSQKVGMQEFISSNYEGWENLINQANEILGWDLGKMISEGPSEDLNLTQHAQPALFTISVAYIEALREKGIKWDAVAGHSLGEYAALYAAECFDFKTGLELVKKRGLLMSKISDESLGMAAVMGMDPNILERTVDEIDNLYVANLNSPAQIVISGKKNAIEQSGDLLKEKGARRVIPLAVSGAFHSPFMNSVADDFKDDIENAEIKEAAMDLYPNVLAKATRDPKTIKESLLSQISGKVRWIETVESMNVDSVTKIYEAGPGATLVGLVKKCNKDIEAQSASKLLDN